MSQRSSLFRQATSVSPAVAFAVVLLVGALPSRASAADDLYPFRAGVHSSREHPLKQKQLQILLKELRFWTGLTEIGIDANEQLSLGDRSRVAGGSVTARALIIAAVGSQDSFILENRDHSPIIAFAQIAETDDYVDAAGHRHGGWQLRIDFSDFTNLRGDNASLASFDPAISMLHELAHGVLKLRDPISPEDQLGDCERHINRMRAELGLPERQNYYPRSRRVITIESPTEVLQGELTFLQRSEQTQKKKTLLVTFNLHRVGGKEVPFRIGSTALARRFYVGTR